MADDPTIVRQNGRQWIELTDDVRLEEPVAWMVLMHNTTMQEYRVFTCEREAFDCAAEQANESGVDWLVYPLYPTHGRECCND